MKHTPPAYAIGFDPDDYDMRGYHLSQISDGTLIPVPTATQEHQIVHEQEQEEKEVKMAAIKKTTAPSAAAATKEVKEKVVKEPKPSFAKECTALLIAGKMTDEEISEQLAPNFPDLKDTSPGAVNYYRKLYNAKVAKDGGEEIERLYRNEKGKLVPASLYVPAPAAKVEAPAAAAPAKKVAIKKA